MKNKILLFLILLSSISFAQVSNGGEQEFDYGIKNNASTEIATPPFLVSQGIDGTYGKMNRNNVIEYLEFASAVNLPVTGEQGKLYLTKDNNRLYRFNGAIYQELTTDISGKEDIANKSNSYSVSSTVTYPNTKALVDGLGTKISGTLTTNIIPKSFGTKSIGDSSLNDNGTTVTTNLPIHANSFVKSIGSTNLLLASGSDITQGSLPISTATQTALNLKANLASPVLTGTPTAPTATAGTNTTQIATTAFVTSAVSTTNANAVLLTGNQSGISGAKSWNDNTQFPLNNGISLTNSSSNSTYGAGALLITNTGGGLGSSILNNSVGFGLGILNSSTGTAIQLQQSSNGRLIQLSNIGAGLGLAISNNSTGTGIHIAGNSTGSNIISGQNSVGTGFNFVGQNNSTNTFTVDKFGATTATSFIKSSAPATNILLAGGGDIAQNTAFNKPFGITAGTVVEGGTLGTNAYSSIAYLPLSGGTVTGNFKLNGLLLSDNFTGGNLQVLNPTEVALFLGNPSLINVNYETGTRHQFYVGNSLKGRFNSEGLFVDGTVTATSLPVFENNAAASSLAVGQFYRTSTGVLMVKF